MLLLRAVVQGLGNKFLDDLRNADLLLHVIDASGTTNAKVSKLGRDSRLHCIALMRREQGEATTGYDPVNDVEWLRAEIHAYDDADDASELATVSHTYSIRFDSVR